MDELETWIRELPKADLHLHLDGAVRPQTAWELAQERGIALPAASPEELRTALTWRPGYTIQECLKTFDLITPLLQDATALRRVAREVVEDAATQGCTSVEVRYAPTLSTRGGLSAAEVVEATMAGFTDAGIPTGLILCCWRAMTAREADEIAELAVAYAGRGVIGIDIVDVAGAAAVQDLSRFREAYKAVGKAGLGRTCHAGEIGGPASIKGAVEVLGVDRIGHGVAAVQDRNVVELLRDRHIPVEVCLSSNLFTGTVARLQDHPLPALRAAGVPVVICTDDPAMEASTLSREYRLAAEAFGLDQEDLRELAAASIAALFPAPATQP